MFLVLASDMVYEFSLLGEILIAAGALLALLSLTRLDELAYWSWNLYAPRIRDKVVAVALAAAQVLLLGLLAAIVPLVHNAVGVRPISGTGVAFLIAESVLAGWAALALIPDVERHPGHEPSLRELLIIAARSVASALNKRARVCVRPRLEAAMDTPTTRSRILHALRDGVAPPDRPAADLLAEIVTDAWNQGDVTARDYAMSSLCDYVNDRRISPRGAGAH